MIVAQPRALAQIVLAVLTLLLVFSCKEKVRVTELAEGAQTSALATPPNALSEALLISLGQAQNFHSKADVLVDSGELTQALTTLEMILQIPFPSGAPEGQDVIADTRARMATLRIELGKLDQALQLVDEGIAQSERQSFYLANLHTVRGQVLQAMAKSSAEEFGDDAPTVRELRIEAIKAFDLSIQISEALLNTLSPGTR